MITFVTDVLPGERAFPTQIFQEPLRITDLDGNLVKTVSTPKSGWTHEKLMQMALEFDCLTRDGADAMLGSTWVGSTEV